MPEQPESRARKKYIFDPADVEVLADRFCEAGGKRILMSKESATLIAHALRTYRHLIRTVGEQEMPFAVSMRSGDHRRRSWGSKSKTRGGRNPNCRSM